MEIDINYEKKKEQNQAEYEQKMKGINDHINRIRKSTAKFTC